MSVICDCPMIRIWCVAEFCLRNAGRLYKSTKNLFKQE